MSVVSIDAMRDYLRRSLSSVNENKLRGILAEIDFRDYLSDLGFSERVSSGGWIFRNVGENVFAHNAVVIFPKLILPNIEYNLDLTNEEPPRALHTICATMHQIGIKSYYCYPYIQENDNPESIIWYSTQLGIPEPSPFEILDEKISGFTHRERNYKYLRYDKDTSLIPDEHVAEEFTKENIRIAFCSKFMQEPSDIDGIFWGQERTYPIEIKEKTAACDNKLGEFFGIDVGPFVKLAYYAAKRGNLHSLFIVREIDDVESRQLVAWRFITFDTLAQFASWVPMGGGRNMQGGGSTVVKIPKAEFKELTRDNLSQL